MKFGLADLEAFVAVAETSNFGRAAQAVHVSQPALSRRIAKLEVALGVRLFDRTTRSVSLTSVGRDFSRKARSLLAEAFVLACRRDHPLAHRRKVAWAELEGHEYMTVSKSSGNRLLIDHALARVKAHPRWFYETRHVSTLLGLVEAGLGVAAVPRL